MIDFCKTRKTFFAPNLCQIARNVYSIVFVPHIKFINLFSDFKIVARLSITKHKCLLCSIFSTVVCESVFCTVCHVLV